MPRSATPSDLLACPRVGARTHAPAVRHGPGGVPPGGRGLHLRIDPARGAHHAGTTTPSIAPEASTSALIRSPNGGSLLVRGTYPRVESRCVRYHRPRLAARYPGALSVKRSDDGTLALTVTLSFEDYLKGIAEVPPSWPRAALEAQGTRGRRLTPPA